MPLESGQGENLGTAYGKVVIDSSGVSAGMNQARRDFRSGIQGMGQMVTGLGQSIRGMGQNLQSLGAQTTLAFAPITAAMGSGVNAAMNFQETLTEVQARAGLTAEELEAVRAQTLQLGADTVFSAQQSADAFLQLLTAGLDVNQAMETLPSVLTGAAAAGVDLGTAADQVTNIMSSFGLSAEHAASIVDQMSKAAGASPATMSQMGEALQQVGGVARGMGISLSDTTAVMAIFAQNGIRGSEAATQFRSLLRNMTSDTDSTKAAWDRLGISMFDSQGNMRDLSTVFEELRVALDGVSVEERTQLVQDLAGAYGQMGFNALVAGTSIDSMKDTILSQADAQDVANARMDTFKGAITSLMGSIEALQINTITPFMEETLKPMVQWLIKTVNSINAWSQENKGLTKAIVAVLSVLSVLGPVLFGLGLLISNFGGAFIAVGTAITVFTSGPVLALIAASGAIYWAWRNNFLGIQEVAITAFDNIKNVIDGIRILLTGDFKGGMFGGAAEDSEIVDWWLDLRETIQATIAGLMFNVQRILNRVIGTVRPLFTQLKIFFERTLASIDLNALSEMGLRVASVLWALASPIGQIGLLLKTVFGISFLDIFEFLTGKVTTFFESLNDGKSTLDSMRVAVGGGPIRKAFEFLVGVFEDVQKIVKKDVLPVFNSLRDWFLKDAIPAVLRVLQNQVLPVFEALWSVISAGVEFVMPILMNLANFFIRDVFPTVMQIITTVVIPVFQLLTSIISSIWSTVAPHLANLANWFLTDVLPSVMGVLRDNFLPLVASVVDFLSSLWGTVGPGLMEFGDWFLSRTLPLIMGFISEVVIPGIGLFIDIIRRIWETVSPSLLMLADWFVNTGLPAVMDFVDNEIVPRVETFIEILKKIWTDVEPIIMGLVDWFETTGWPIIHSIIEEVIIPAVEGLVGVLKGIWELVSPLLDLLLAWFADVGWPVIEGIINTGITVVTGLIDVLKTIWDVVEPGLSALQSGMETVFGFIKDNVLDPVMEVINAIISGVGTAVDAINTLGGVDDFVTGNVEVGGHNINPLSLLRDSGGSANSGQLVHVGTPQIGKEAFLVGGRSGTFYNDFANSLANVAASVMGGQQAAQIAAMIQGGRQAASVAPGVGGVDGGGIQVNATFEIPPELLQSTPQARESAGVLADTFKQDLTAKLRFNG